MRRAVVITLVSVACVIALAWAGARYVSARRELATATARYDAVASNVAEIERWRRTQAMIASAAKPQPNLSGQISDTLVEAGLSPNLLTSLAPEPDAPVTLGSSHDYRRQTARLTLEPLTMPDLGRFLGRWVVGQPEWTISGITITPVVVATKPRPGAAESGELDNEHDAVSPDRRVRAVLSIECLYLDHQAPPPATPSAP